MSTHRHIFLILALFLFSSLNFYAQNASVEPEFAGEAVLLKADNSALALEKSHVQIKTKANAGVFIVGIGNVKSRVVVQSCCANVRIPQPGDKVQLVVRAVDNQTDPLSIIKVFKFESKKKERRAELSSASTFGGQSSGNMNLVPYSAKKFGKSSYILTISGLGTGEYGVIVQNPNAVDEKSTIASCFGVD